MNREVRMESTSVICSLGWGTDRVLDRVYRKEGGISTLPPGNLSDTPFPAARLDWQEVSERFDSLKVSTVGAEGSLREPELTRFEKLSVLALDQALQGSGADPSHPATGFILSTTKGNVELLENPAGFERERMGLYRSAEVIAGFFGIRNRPLVISNACISGVAAILLARRLISGGQYTHVLVVGADVLSRFIVSGFQSFLSLSSKPCRPFDAARDGLTLGEAAAAAVISSDLGDVSVGEGAITNDANHISGPSRTGEGLLLAIRQTLRDAQGADMVSAHGTATVYNDEMESLALSRAGLEQVPVNSLKGYVGHTLGAAGVLESVLAVGAMKRNRLIPTLGYQETGVSGKINITASAKEAELQNVLKVASGFGGCNAAIRFTKTP